MSYIDETVCTPDQQEYRTCGPLAWEEIEGGIRIIRLLETSTVVKVPEEIEGKPVVELGDGCFSGMGQLENVILPNTLKKIGRMAFSTCRHLKTLILPDSVEELGSHMLSDTSVTSLKLPNNLKAVPPSAFSYCQSLKKVELNEGLLSIGAHAFNRTRVGEDEPLIIPDSVKEIAPGAFYTFIGDIKVKTTLPVDPFWFSDLPAPFSPDQEKKPGMITQATSKAVLQLLQSAASQLTQKTVEIRWHYGKGLVSLSDVRVNVGEAYQTVIYEFERALHKMCSEKKLDWNEAEFRYLNEILLLSCGMGYRLDQECGPVASLLEDTKENSDLANQMHNLILEKQS